MKKESVYPNTIYRVSTKAFITNEEKKILLVKEWKLWRELPGGGLDFEETPEIWLIREIQEELSVKAEIQESRPIYIRTQRREVKRLYFLYLWYKVTINSTKFEMKWDGMEKEEFEERKFFSKEELSKIDLHENVSKLPEIYNPDDFL